MAQNKKSSLLEACLGKGQKLNELVQYAADSIVSKTILDKPVGTITLFAFDKGQRLSEHTAPVRCGGAGYRWNRKNHYRRQRAEIDSERNCDNARQYPSFGCGG